VLIHTLGVQLLQRLGDAAVGGPPLVLEHAVVGGLLGEDVLEDILALGQARALVDQFGALEGYEVVE
jgi:hypothetical protein